MYGWRARIGHVYPAVVAETIFHDFFRMVPEGVSLVLTHLSIEILQRSDLERSLDQMDRAADHLAERGVDIIIIGGAPMIRLRGKGSDAPIIERIQQRTGILTTTSQTAAVEAFNHLGLQRLAVATPYQEDQDVRLKKFLEDSGFDVLNIQGLRKNVAEIHAIPLATAFRHVKEAFLRAPGADGVYVPCAHFTVPQLELLEQEIGRPIITSTGAMVWKALKELHICEPVPGQGRLLTSLVGPQLP